MHNHLLFLKSQNYLHLARFPWGNWRFNSLNSRTSASLALCMAPFLLNDRAFRKGQFRGVIKKVYLKLWNCRSQDRTNCTLLHPCHSGSAVCLGYLSTAISSSHFCSTENFMGNSVWLDAKRGLNLPPQNSFMYECVCMHLACAHMPAVVHLCMSTRVFLSFMWERRVPENNAAGHVERRKEKRSHLRQTNRAHGFWSMTCRPLHSSKYKSLILVLEEAFLCR